MRTGYPVYVTADLNQKVTFPQPSYPLILCLLLEAFRSARNGYKPILGICQLSFCIFQK
jgi:hypothetical protein